MPPRPIKKISSGKLIYKEYKVSLSIFSCLTRICHSQMPGEQIPTPVFPPLSCFAHLPKLRAGNGKILFCKCELKPECLLRINSEPLRKFRNDSLWFKETGYIKKNTICSLNESKLDKSVIKYVWRLTLWSFPQQDPLSLFYQELATINRATLLNHLPLLSLLLNILLKHIFSSQTLLSPKIWLITRWSCQLSIAFGLNCNSQIALWQPVAIS